MTEFGRTVFIHGIVLHGYLTEDSWLAFLANIVDQIKMTAVGSPVITHYGEIGDIYHQPIGESFITIDVWPNHNAAYLHIVSCKNFEASCLTELYITYSLKTGQTLNSRMKVDG